MTDEGNDKSRVDYTAGPRRHPVPSPILPRTYSPTPSLWSVVPRATSWVTKDPGEPDRSKEGLTLESGSYT